MQHIKLHTVQHTLIIQLFSKTMMVLNYQVQHIIMVMLLLNQVIQQNHQMKHMIMYLVDGIGN